MKKKILRNFNQRLFWILVGLSLSLIAIVGTSIYFFFQFDGVFQVSRKMSKLYAGYAMVQKHESVFIKKGIYNTEFHKTGSTAEIGRLKETFVVLNTDISEMEKAVSKNNIAVDAEISSIKQLLNDYHDSFNSLVQAYKKRGYKDFGLEGEMRKQVHQLQAQGDMIGMDKILMLRRHEKDYLMRNDEEYVQKLSLLVDDIKTDLLMNKKLSIEQKDSYLRLLYDYYGSFSELVGITKQIGMRGELGIYPTMELKKMGLDNSFDKFQRKLAVHEQKMVNWILNAFLLVGGNLLLICVLFVYLYIKYSRKDKQDEDSYISDKVSKDVSPNSTDKLKVI